MTCQAATQQPSARRSHRTSYGAPENGYGGAHKLMPYGSIRVKESVSASLGNWASIENKEQRRRWLPFLNTSSGPFSRFPVFRFLNWVITG